LSLRFGEFFADIVRYINLPAFLLFNSWTYYTIRRKTMTLQSRRLVETASVSNGEKNVLLQQQQ